MITAIIDRMSEAKDIPQGDVVKPDILSPFDSLKELITRETPRAIKSPTTKLHVDICMMVGFRRKDASIMQGYYAATVQLPFADLNALSPEEFNQLKSHLQKTVFTSLEEQRQDIPAHIADIIDPNSPRNILEHEVDHFRPLSRYPNQGARVNISFIKEPGKENTVTSIEGLAEIGGIERVSLYDRAISFSEPKSLNETDIEQAIRAAQKTKDKRFIKTIQERVQARLKH